MEARRDLRCVADSGAAASARSVGRMLRRYAAPATLAPPATPASLPAVLAAGFR